MSKDIVHCDGCESDFCRDCAWPDGGDCDGCNKTLCGDDDCAMKDCDECDSHVCTECFKLYHEDCGDEEE